MSIANNYLWDPQRGDAYEREMMRKQEMLRQHEWHQRMRGISPIDNGGTGRSIAANPVEVVDPKDPLAFLKKADKTVLLTGEAL